MKKKLAVLLTMCVMLSACADTPESSQPTELVVSNVPNKEVAVSAFPVEICGTELSAAAERVVSLSPAVTEILSEIGCAEKIAGKSRYCDYPESLSASEVGSAENPDINAIIELSPDVLFTLTPLAERDVYTLETAGVAVITLTPPTDMDSYAKLYSDIASVFLGKAQTDSEKKTELAAKTGSAARVYVETAAETVALGTFVYVTGKLTLSGGKTFENALLSLCGENLVYAEGYCDAASAEGLSPAYIVADSALTLEALRSSEPLKAMIDGGAKVLFVTSRYFERPTKRSAEVFSELSEQLSEPAE